MDLSPAPTPHTTRSFSIAILDRNTGYYITAPVIRTYTIESEQGAAALESARYLQMRAESLYAKEIEKRLPDDAELNELLKSRNWKVTANLLTFIEDQDNASS